MDKVEIEEIELGGKRFSIETGKFAKQANGSVLVICEETQVLVTAVFSPTPKEEIDFFPLTVDVEERMYAAGKIPGGFFKREGKPSEKSILTARLIDRPLRPCFPEGMRNEVQIIATILSVDQINPPDILALNGASCALTISDIPFNGPIGAVRIGRVHNQWIINPTYQEIEYGDFDIVVAGNREGILMVEAGAKEVTEEDVIIALKEAHSYILHLIELQESLRKKVGKPKQEVNLAKDNPELEKSLKELAAKKIAEAIKIPEKLEREEALEKIKSETISFLATKFTEEVNVQNEKGETIGKAVFPSEKFEREAIKIFEKVLKEEVRKMVLDKGIRVDGRKTDEIRPINCEVTVLPRPHGSALFSRGQTQVLSIVTLGTASEEQILDGIEVEESKKFLHHYNFPPFCTGEVGPMRGPRRREIGHGALVERALISVIPPESEFPYTIRIVSEVLESNGSTSMASVCSSTLALMDAGVPIKAPIGGIAMGLIKENDKIAILTDILGMEDALGDMDFKVAGTERGITALQMDIKIGGVSFEILNQALEKAKKARLFILNKMKETLPAPRKELSRYAPRMIILKINPEKIRDIIGPSGRTIHSIIDETGVTIDIEQDGTVFIASKDEIGAEKAKEIIENLTKEVKVGERFLGRVTRVTNFGAFVEILPGKEGLVHISKLSKRRVRFAEEVVKPGDKILVEVIEIDSLNRINLASVEYLEVEKGIRGNKNHQEYGRF